MSNPVNDEQALAERVAERMWAHDTFSRAMGMTLVDVKPRSAVMQMTVRPDHLNGFGACHGGVIFSLADSAFAFCCNTHGRVTVAIENTITYPKRVSAGDVLVATAREEIGSTRLSFCHIEIHRNGELVSVFRGTGYKTDKPVFPNPE